MPPRPRPPREVPKGILPQPERRPLREALASAAAHAAIVLLALLVVNTPPPEEPPPPAEQPPPPPPQTITLPPYVPPEPRPQPAPAPQPRPILPSSPQQTAPSPTPAASPAEREERPNAPPEEQKRDGIREPEPEAEQTPKAPERGTPTPTTPAPARTPQPPLAKAAESAQEAEARRLFGTKRRADATDDPISMRPLALGPDGKPMQCEPLPKFERDSLGRAPIGVAVGRILRDDGRPLSGALLQMVGTQFVAFTDDAGEYRFSYDMSLIENCRTQYVRVSAKGYESRLLVLVIGAQVRSEDVALRRSSRFPLGIRPGG